MFWKRCFKNYFEKNNLEVFYKGGKTVFLKIRGCRKKFVECRKKLPEKNLGYLSLSPKLTRRYLKP